MKNVAGPLLLMLLVCAYHSTPASGQSLSLSSDSKLWVDGTSNKDDWSVKATELDGTAQAGENGTVGSLTLTVPAAKMISEKSSIMDRLMYKTLKVDQHPAIVFELTSLDAMDGDSLAASGSLMIAGVSKEVTVGVKRSTDDDGVARYTGSYALKMTDYEMKPPSALFGALHTADDVVVHFDLGLGKTESGS